MTFVLGKKTRKKYQAVSARRIVKYSFIVAFKLPTVNNANKLVIYHLRRKRSKFYS